MLAEQYVHAVESAGGAALMLTHAHRPAALRALADRLDGLVLSGGEDVDPTTYGAVPREPLDAPNAERDRFELRLLDLVAERRVPILAICRGFQLLNVYRGGTLHLHLPRDRAGEVVHQQGGGLEAMGHPVEVTAGSRLESLAGRRRLEVNSFHHQGVDRLGAGLRATGHAPDGLVEAFESDRGGPLIGVQWHPERGGDASEALFRWLVQSAATGSVARSAWSDGPVGGSG
jgi:putative glutamine amidotransferase